MYEYELVIIDGVLINLSFDALSIVIKSIKDCLACFTILDRFSYLKCVMVNVSLITTYFPTKI
jgi:hypothetical protein